MSAKTTTTLTTEHGSISVCQTDGPGMPLLMLHGLGAGKDVFEHQLTSPLGGLHRLVAFDLPGHGASDNATDPQKTYTLPALADLTGEVLTQLGIARAAVFGWSLGGHIAIQMLATHAPMVAGLMLTGAPPFSRNPLGELRAFHLSRDVLLASKVTFTDRDAQRFERMCFGADADGSHLTAIQRADGRFRPLVNRSLRHDAPDQRRLVEASDVPVAIVNGSDEPVVRLGSVAAIRYRHLWEGMTHVLPNAGHAPFVNTPNAFNALLHRFVTYVAVREHQVPMPAPVVVEEVAEGVVRSA